MRNIALELSYDGTNYAGWQIQDNAKTIQGTVQEVLEKIVKHRVKMTYAGRTDAGVHALGQVAAFTTTSRMTEKQFEAALNSELPYDIRVRRAFETPAGFHARYDARMRWYRYLIWNSSEQVPFFKNYALWLWRGLDTNLLDRYCKEIIGEHDFTSFATIEEGENPVRTVFECKVTKRNDFVVFDVVANSFLRKMVRTIIGTFLELEKAGENPGRVKEILYAKDRRKAGMTVYPGGLYFVKVFF